jgi:hypothetical protein
MDKITLINLENTDRQVFLEILKRELKSVLGNDLPENYGNEVDWGLIKLLEDEKIDSYQLIYVNDIFWAASGGMIRYIDNQMIYQAGFRTFSNSNMDMRLFNKSHIGCKSYGHKINTKYQLERAKTLGCNKMIISFNEHNSRLFRITRDYHLPKAFKDRPFKSSEEMINFNGVPQWLITFELQK